MLHVLSNLYQGAQHVVAHHDGIVPDTFASNVG
jgi:adenine-specific DNA glycosylase